MNTGTGQDTLMPSDEESFNQEIEDCDTNRGNGRGERNGRNKFNGAKTQNISFNTKGLFKNNMERAEKLKREQEELE